MTQLEDDDQQAAVFYAVDNAVGTHTEAEYVVVTL
jgi:hypothetical protein